MGDRPIMNVSGSTLVNSFPVYKRNIHEAKFAVEGEHICTTCSWLGHLTDTITPLNKIDCMCTLHYK